MALAIICVAIFVFIIFGWWWADAYPFQRTKPWEPLAACPNCRSKNILLWRYKTDEYRYSCKDCHYDGGLYYSLKKAKQAWNRDSNV